ncbi:hypothetical protein NEIPOLOT_00760 [Neisseria polysaccharea ATCC 43768]|nr:hypothetical protein NEIPOLOT_00760 [Neisseria polysaccharea ATCC 43768]
MSDKPACGIDVGAVGKPVQGKIAAAFGLHPHQWQTESVVCKQHGMQPFLPALLQRAIQSIEFFGTEKTAFHMILIAFCAAAYGIVKQGEIRHGNLGQMF